MIFEESILHRVYNRYKVFQKFTFNLDVNLNYQFRVIKYYYMTITRDKYIFVVRRALMEDFIVRFISYIYEMSY